MRLGLGVRARSERINRLRSTRPRLGAIEYAIRVADGGTRQNAGSHRHLAGRHSLLTASYARWRADLFADRKDEPALQFQRISTVGTERQLEPSAAEAGRKCDSRGSGNGL